jgi:hypothetical protein
LFSGVIVSSIPGADAQELLKGLHVVYMSHNKWFYRYCYVTLCP